MSLREILEKTIYPVQQSEPLQSAASFHPHKGKRPEFQHDNK